MLPKQKLLVPINLNAPIYEQAPITKKRTADAFDKPFKKTRMRSVMHAEKSDVILAPFKFTDLAYSSKFLQINKALEQNSHFMKNFFICSTILNIVNHRSNYRGFKTYQAKLITSLDFFKNKPELSIRFGTHLSHACFIESKIVRIDLLKLIDELKK